MWVTERQTGLTPQQILAALVQNGEVFTLLTFGAGTALLAAHRQRRAKKSTQA